MSGNAMGELDFDRLDDWARGLFDLTGEEARALVAEVRRLRADREMGRTNLAYYRELIDAYAGKEAEAIAEVERLRAALEVIAGDDLDYLGRLKLTDAENAIYVIARDALGRPA